MAFIQITVNECCHHHRRHNLFFSLGPCITMPVKKQKAGATATLQLLDDQKCDLQVTSVDDAGNPSGTLPGTPTWTVSDPTVLTLTVDAADPSKATIASTAKLAPAPGVQVAVSCPQADATLPPLTGMLTVIVSASAASTISVMAGTPVHV